MDSYDTTTYGDHWADVYDEWHTDDDDVPAPLDLLEELAGGGRALELGIGTGRVALRLAARGVPVAGVESSRKMVKALKAKRGAKGIKVFTGDMATVDAGGPYNLVFVVDSTLYCLPDQDTQVRCFENVVRHLTDDGVFVVSGFVPDVDWWPRDQGVETADVAVGSVTLEAYRHDRAEQRIDWQTVVLGRHGNDLYPVGLRYVWPSELDLMARLAGLRLRQRWGGHEGEEYGAHSRHQLSVYERDL